MNSTSGSIGMTRSAFIPPLLNWRGKIMSKQKESKKLNRLEINRETVRDLDANNAGEVRGGATVNMNPTLTDQHCTVLVTEADPITIREGAPSDIKPRP